MGDLNLDERLSLGMPISDYEYDSSKKLLLPKKQLERKKLLKGKK